MLWSRLLAGENVTASAAAAAAAAAAADVTK
jgi:hypothetical protein